MAYSLRVQSTLERKTRNINKWRRVRPYVDWLHVADPVQAATAVVSQSVEVWRFHHIQKIPFSPSSQPLAPIIFSLGVYTLESLKDIYEAKSLPKDLKARVGWFHVSALALPLASCDHRKHECLFEYPFASPSEQD